MEQNHGGKSSGTWRWDKIGKDNKNWEYISSKKAYEKFRLSYF
jgi:hypothetical protein